MRNGLPVIAALLALGVPHVWADSADSEVSEISALAEFQSESSDSHNLLIRSEDVPANVRYDEKCCKVCTKGKACGNSCINRDYQCHQPPGCACDG